MARARNIKPAFFVNEDLAEQPFQARLFFIGLWCLCDCEGKMEFRPKRVKAELFPYDDIDCEMLAQCLHSAGFVQIYVVDSVRYLKVSNFLRHQHPNVKEKPQGLPEPTAENREASCQHNADTVPTRPLTPYPIPHTETPIPLSEPVRAPAPSMGHCPPEVSMAFDQVFSAYPPNRRDRRTALPTFVAMNLYEDVEAITAGVAALRASHEWQREQGRWIPNLSLFLERRGWEAVAPRAASTLSEAELDDIFGAPKPTKKAAGHVA